MKAIFSTHGKLTPKGKPEPIDAANASNAVGVDLNPSVRIR